MPIVQFAAEEFFCQEGEQNAEIWVVRAGNLQVESNVRYRTVDGSAVGGVTFEPTVGSLVFKPGEVEKSVCIKLLDDDIWHTTLEFGVELDSSCVSQAELGEHLWRTTLVVLDNDTFPTGRYQRAIKGSVQARVDLHRAHIPVPTGALLVELCRMMAVDSTIRRGALKIFAVDILHNVFIFSKAFMMATLVDRILIHTEDEMQLVIIELLTLTIATIFLFGTLHFLDYKRLTWKVKGTCRRTLQCAIMRRFFNFDATRRAGLKDGGLIIAMTHDCNMVLQEGLMNVFPLVQAVGSTAMMAMYQLGYGPIFGAGFRWSSVVPLCIFPVLYVVFLWSRLATTQHHLTSLHEKMDDLFSYCDYLIQSYSLIVDFNVRRHFVAGFDDRVVGFNTQDMATNQTLLNNARFAPWLAVMVSAAYQVFGGIQVVRRECKLGTYLVNLGLFAQFGEAWGKIYSIVLCMISCVPNLHRVVLLLNMETNFDARKELSDGSLHTSRRLIVDNLRQFPLRTMVLDVLPIRVECRGADPLDIRQGQLVYIIGPHGEGKTVLLRSIARQISVGMEDKHKNHHVKAFVPPHLRTVFVPTEPIFFVDKPLLDNLLIGVPDEDKSTAKARVLDICKCVGLPKALNDSMITADGTTAWVGILSQTQRQLLSLVRALTANSEILCMSQPLQCFNPEERQKLLVVFRAFVDQDGFNFRPGSGNVQRPRTVILTTTAQLDDELADQIVEVTNEGGVRDMTLEDMRGLNTADFLHHDKSRTSIHTGL